MKLAKPCLLFFTLLISTLFSFKSIGQSISIDSLAKNNSNERYTQWISFSHINDLFRLDGISDRYYSFGHQIDYLRKIKPHKSENQSMHYNIGLNFQGYTPEHELDKIDSSTTRPFAAWSYLTLGFINAKPESNIKYQLELGYIGPKARGMEIQNWVHRNISDDPEVIGWKEQIDNQIGINLSVDYRKTVVKGGNHILLAGTEQKLGNVFTYIWPSLRYQFNGKANNGFLPFQYAASPSSNFTIEANIGFKYEFFNLTIEGEPTSETFNPLEEEVIYRALFTAGLGVRYHFRHFSLHFSNSYNSKRLQSNHNHIYGVLGLSYSW